jgi:hypothetical protein
MLALTFLRSQPLPPALLGTRGIQRARLATASVHGRTPLVLSTSAVPMRGQSWRRHRLPVSAGARAPSTTITSRLPPPSAHAVVNATVPPPLLSTAAPMVLPALAVPMRGQSWRRHRLPVFASARARSTTITSRLPAPTGPPRSVKGGGRRRPSHRISLCRRAGFGRVARRRGRLRRLSAPFFASPLRGLRRRGRSVTGGRCGADRHRLSLRRRRPIGFASRVARD